MRGLFGRLVFAPRGLFGCRFFVPSRKFFGCLVFVLGVWFLWFLVFVVFALSGFCPSPLWQPKPVGLSHGVSEGGRVPGLPAQPQTHIMDHMRTTLELPDDLFAAAKATALRRRITLKALVTRAIERELRASHDQGPHPRFDLDESGWPVRRSAAGESGMITDAFIDALREREGV